MRTNEVHTEVKEGRQGVYIPKHAAQNSKSRNKGNKLFSVVICVLIAVTIASIFNSMFGIAVVQGSSMEPELREGDVILFWKLSSSYDSGDIVLIKTDGRDDLVKRVCALPGDTVEIDNTTGTLYINGKDFKKSYTYEETYGKVITYPLVVGEDEYFVLGDHRSKSYDSRDYGAVDVRRIDGKALIVFRQNMQGKEI